LRTLLARLDALADRDRETALQLLVGTTEQRRFDARFDDEDAKVFREFAKAVEDHIGETEQKARRERLGLDWDVDQE
jgi:hypothetical protein